LKRESASEDIGIRTLNCYTVLGNDYKIHTLQPALVKCESCNKTVEMNSNSRDRGLYLPE
jgi:hypothetical protein